MGSNRYKSLTLIMVLEGGNNYTINNVFKIETYFNKDSQLSLRIYYLTNSDGYVDVSFIYDNIKAILIIGEK